MRNFDWRFPPRARNQVIYPNHNENNENVNNYYNHYQPQRENNSATNLVETLQIPNRPNNINSLDTIEMNANFEDPIMLTPINYTKPVLVLNNENRYKRGYQNNASIAHLRRNGENPLTKKKIKRTRWMKPVRKNKN